MEEKKSHIMALKNALMQSEWEGESRLTPV